MLAFADMMKKQIVMPAHLMDDCQHFKATGRPLFDDFSTVAEKVGVYTASDYADIMEHLVKRWEVEGRLLTGEAADAQVRSPPLPTLWMQRRRFAILRSIIKRGVGRERWLKRCEAPRRVGTGQSTRPANSAV
jgi:hypothetical protein